MSVADLLRDFLNVQAERARIYNSFESAFVSNLAGASPDSAFHRVCQGITAEFSQCSQQVRDVEARLRAEGVGLADLADVVSRVQEQEKEKLHLTAVHQVLRKSLRPSDRSPDQIASFLPQRPSSQHHHHHSTQHHPHSTQQQQQQQPEQPEQMHPREQDQGAGERADSANVSAVDIPGSFDAAGDAIASELERVSLSSSHAPASNPRISPAATPAATPAASVTSESMGISLAAKQGIDPAAAAAPFAAARTAGGCGCGHGGSTSPHDSTGYRQSNGVGGDEEEEEEGEGEEEGEYDEAFAVARLDAEYDAAVAEVRQALARIVGEINEALEEVRYAIAEEEGMGEED